jgi:SAM-dependent methyltransferase
VRFRLTCPQPTVDARLCGKYSLAVTTSVARYDGYSQWYERTFSTYSYKAEREFLRNSLGSGQEQICLDVACGTGIHDQLLADAGYRVLGIDISSDQLRLARSRVAAAVQADACFLPVADEVVAVVVGMFFHTDVEDFAAVIRDVARCLRAGGRFIYVGPHPCFIGPFVDRTTECHESALKFVKGYGANGWTRRGSGGVLGLWSRVGGHHKTLAGFINAIAGSGLRIESVAEFAGGGTVLPRNVAVVADKTGMEH